MTILPVGIKAERIRPQVGVMVNLPNGNLNVGSGRNAILSDLSVLSRFPGHEHDHGRKQTQRFTENLIQVSQLASTVIIHFGIVLSVVKQPR